LLLLELGRDDLPLSDRRFIDIANLVVLVAFAVDYFVEQRLASNRRNYVRHEWTSLVIVVTQAIAIAPGALSVFGVFRVLRAAPAMRGVRRNAAPSSWGSPSVATCSRVAVAHPPRAAAWTMASDRDEVARSEGTSSAASR
jgi:hypothetical protein